AVVERAHRMGIESNLIANQSIALGTSEVTPLELTAAYVPLANGGYRPDVHFVERVTTVAGAVLYERQPGKMKRVLEPRVVGMMNSMMRATLIEGTARKAAFAWPAAGKTGTSQASRDAWFVGYTANLTTGVWFGNDDGKPTKNLTGGSLPAIAWHDFMVAAHEGVAVADLPGEYDGTAHVQDEPVAIDEPVAAVEPEPLIEMGGRGGVTVAPAAKPKKPMSDAGKRPLAETAKKRDVQPAAKPARAVAPAGAKKVDDFTASIPRPKADVGGGKRTSIVDVINGG
ncbi:MAG: penicillin-binding transpeptidase domain-containing protein, partial [Rhizobiaceae bacterium]